MAADPAPAGSLPAASDGRALFVTTTPVMPEPVPSGSVTHSHSASVLVTITGRDRPGVTAALFAALAGHDVEINDVEQVVIRGRLVLCVLLTLRGDSGPLRRSISNTADALGVEADIVVSEGTGGTSGTGGPGTTGPGTTGSGSTGNSRWRNGRHHVILIGRPLRAGSISHIAQRIADLGANIDSITQLGSYPVDSIELMVSQADASELRSVLVQATADSGIDVAVEPAGLTRRAKRLVVLDVDSTLVTAEGIDLLADLAGAGTEVARITAAAMAGEIDFSESLRQRVGLLAGLPYREVERVRDELVLTPGARTLVHTLRLLGFRVGVVSGGFTAMTDRFVAELGLDFAAANQLEVVDGRLTGQVIGDIVDRAGKAEALRQFAEQFGIPMAQTVAIGDGANDIDMIEAAGLGIAFNGKAALRASADAAVNHPFLDTVLFVLGLSRAEIDEAIQDDPTHMS